MAMSQSGSGVTFSGGFARVHDSRLTIIEHGCLPPGDTILDNDPLLVLGIQ